MAIITRATSTLIAIGNLSIGAMVAACGATPGEDSGKESAESLSSCALSVTSNIYDGSNYWGTVTIKNTGAAKVTGLGVELLVPSGVHCTNDAVPSGAVLSPLTGSGSSATTKSNVCTFTWASTSLAAGASLTFNYSTDSTAFSSASSVKATSPSCSSSGGGSSSGSTSGSSSGTSSGGSSGTSSGSSGGPWTGIKVSGTGFVDSTGAEFLPRGLAPGEWHNIESYMIGLSLNSDSPGLGQTGLKNKLTLAMGATNAEHFFATWDANVVTADDVTEWGTWGVNSVRLPMNYHDLTTADGVYLEAGFETMDKFIAWCKTNHIYVILDLHAAPGAQNCEEMSDTTDGVAHLWKEPTKYRQWTIDLWQTIAKRYANEPAVMGFDIFDEPYDVEDDGSFSGGTAAVLRPMYLDITKAIRAVDPNHILIFEGANWLTGDGFSGLSPAWDPQMAWSFHEYVDLDNNDALTASILKTYTNLRKSTNRPIWHGETGEHSYAWFTATIAQDEANKIGWNVWTYKKANDVSNDYDPSGKDPTQAYSIKEPSNYSAMQTYLNGGKMPATAEATTVMMAFAANAATNACVYNSSYVKAVFNK